MVLRSSSYLLLSVHLKKFSRDEVKGATRETLLGSSGYWDKFGLRSAWDSQVFYERTSWPQPRGGAGDGKTHSEHSEKKI